VLAAAVVSVSVIGRGFARMADIKLRRMRVIMVKMSGQEVGQRHEGKGQGNLGIFQQFGLMARDGGERMM
jgi:hypothetical protein